MSKKHVVCAVLRAAILACDDREFAAVTAQIEEWMYDLAHVEGDKNRGDKNRAVPFMDAIQGLHVVLDFLREYLDQEEVTALSDRL